MSTLLLSVDFEDWHQLVRRRLGLAAWEAPGPALARQTDALLNLLDTLGVKATFFVLGIAARAHPALLARVVARGHEIGCHGDQHRLVFTQTPDEFAQDIRAARQTIEQQTGRAPVGYRAPAFSITRRSPWAHDVLAQEGFVYDASQHDSPRIRGRVTDRPAGPHQLSAGLWEFPVAVGGKLPVGGPSYWALLPTPVVLHGLQRAGDFAGLYLHPHELDPEPLRVGGGGTRAKLKELQRNSARWRTPTVLRAIAREHQLIPYGEAHARLSDCAAASP